ncbi:MAG TPA: type II toxin-antitoxin system VapC family toxin [Candidatus Binatia bacterium]|jgi:predicted nucleic acid-binding protein|nr:type II toxin-antitoxin system VapC family toxin [Candidatus Binatia bacterium]
MKIVLDAWAILAYLQREEPAASRVREILKKAEARQVDLCVSLINVGEVFYSIGRRRGEQAAEETLEELHCLPVTILPPEPDTVLKAARLKMHHALSYADAFAVVTAQDLHATLMTGDPEILAIKDIVAVEPLQRG